MEVRDRVTWCPCEKHVVSCALHSWVLMWGSPSGLASSMRTVHEDACMCSCVCAPVHACKGEP